MLAQSQETPWNDSQPIYRQLKAKLLEMILDGHVAEGEAMPSVRQISLDMKINPITVIKAVQELESEGAVEKRAVAQRDINRDAGAADHCHFPDTTAERPGVIGAEPAETQQPLLLLKSANILSQHLRHFRLPTETLSLFLAGLAPERKGFDGDQGCPARGP